MVGDVVPHAYVLVTPSWTCGAVCHHHCERGRSDPPVGGVSSPAYSDLLVILWHALEASDVVKARLRQLVRVPQVPQLDVRLLAYRRLIGPLGVVHLQVSDWDQIIRSIRCMGPGEDLLLLTIIIHCQGELYCYSRCRSIGKPAMCQSKN